MMSLPVLDGTTEIFKADSTSEMHKAVAPMTDGRSRDRNQTYRFDVLVHMGPF